MHLSIIRCVAPELARLFFLSLTIALDNQLVQHTCTFDVQRGVSCRPFVRTFLRLANGSFEEVTPSVNQGGRLPGGRVGVAEAMYVADRRRSRMPAAWLTALTICSNISLV